MTALLFLILSLTVTLGSVFLFHNRVSRRLFPTFLLLMNGHIWLFYLLLTR